MKARIGKFARLAPVLSSGIPRFAAHGWALALALLVLAPAPLGFRQPITQASATTSSGLLPYKTSIDDSTLWAPSTPAQARQLTPPVRYQVKPGDSVDSIAARAGIAVDTLVQVNHLSWRPLLTPGQPVIVPPIDGTMVRVDPQTQVIR